MSDFKRRPIAIFGSGTNISRMSIGANKVGKKLQSIVHVSIATYSELERRVNGTVRRAWYRLMIPAKDKLVKEAINRDGIFSWNRVWSDVWKHQKLLAQFVLALFGVHDESGIGHLWNPLNLSIILRRKVRAVMLFTGADIDPMNQFGEIAKTALGRRYTVIVLNSSKTSNIAANEVVNIAIRNAQNLGLEGVLIITNTMGSRSFSVSEIDASILMFDRGGEDATTQKESRSDTPGLLWDGSRKEFGIKISLSVDPDRDNMPLRLALLEATNLAKEKGISLPAALRQVIPSYNIFTSNEYGSYIQLQVEPFLNELQDNDFLLKVANVSYDINILLESPYLQEIVEAAATIFENQKGANKKLLDKARTFVEDKTREQRPGEEKEKKNEKDFLKLLDKAIRALNQSATAVYLLANEGDTYRECLEVIKKDPEMSMEFKELWKVTPSQVLNLLDTECLPEQILDIVVANSKNILSTANQWSCK